MSKTNRKIKKNKMHNVGIVIYIGDEKFLKYIKELLMQLENANALIWELNYILKYRELRMYAVSYLIEFLADRFVHSTTYQRDIEYACAKGMSFDNARIMAKKSRKEHKYMYKVLANYFTWTINYDTGLISVSDR